MSVLGKRLKQAREESRYTQVIAAEKLGISNGTLSGYEREYRDPDTDILNKMADLYGVSVEWLMGRSDNKQVDQNSGFSKLNSKDERDIAKRIEEIKQDLIKGSPDGEGLKFMGEPMCDEAIESLLEALEHAERITTLANKKYKTNDQNYTSD